MDRSKPTRVRAGASTRRSQHAQNWGRISRGSFELKFEFEVQIEFQFKINFGLELEVRKLT